MKRILITGGGTGGHIYPSIAVLEELEKQYDGNVEYIYVGSGTDLEGVLREKVDRDYSVMTGKFRRYFSLKNITDIFRIPVGFVQSLIIMLREMPDVVFSKGGYVSVPVVLAAWAYRVPILIHESDAVPGASNRFLGKFCTRIVLGYNSARNFFLERKTRVTGNPVSQNVIGGDRQKAYETLGLTESRPTIFIVGGSQGSKMINEHISGLLDEMLEFSQIIHQTGKDNFDEMVHLAAQNAGIKAGRRGYHIKPFLTVEQMRAAYAVADLVIARAGATTIAEVAANDNAAIFIPLANAANDHQRMNAYEVAEVGGAVVLEEANLTEHVFLNKIKTVLLDGSVRVKMRNAIKEFYHPSAAKEIAEEVIALIK